MNKEQESQQVDETSKKDNVFPITCPSCGKTHEWKIEEPEKPFFYICPDCGTRTDFPPLISKSPSGRIKAYLKRNKTWAIIGYGGLLIALLFFFAGGINYSGPIGKYGGTFLQHLEQQINNGEKFNNFLIFTWLFIPAVGGIVAFLGLIGSHRRSEKGKRTVAAFVLLLAVASFFVLLAAITTIYNLRLLRTGDLSNETNYFYPKASPYFSTFICLGLILVVITAALIKVLGLKKKNMKKASIFTIVFLILVIPAIPLFIQVSLVPEKSNSNFDTHFAKEVMMKEFYDYLASSHFDANKYLPPHSRILPSSLRFPPDPNSANGFVTLKGTPYENRDPSKAMYISFNSHCDSYDQAIDFYANNFTRSDLPFDQFYLVLASTSGVDDIVVVDGFRQEIYLSRVLLINSH